MQAAPQEGHRGLTRGGYRTSCALGDLALCGGYCKDSIAHRFMGHRVRFKQTDLSCEVAGGPRVKCLFRAPLQ